MGICSLKTTYGEFAALGRRAGGLADYLFTYVSRKIADLSRQKKKFFENAVSIEFSSEKQPEPVDFQYEGKSNQTAILLPQAGDKFK